MEAIWKFPLSLTDEQEASVPSGAQFLTVQMQNGGPCLWAIVNTEAVLERRTVLCRGTGHPLTGSEGRYISTVQERVFVWHFFEKDAHD